MAHRSWHGSPVLLLVVTGALLGATFPLGRLSAAAGVPAPAWAFLISGGAGAVLMAATLAGRQGFALDGRHLRYYALAGTISYAMPNLLIFSAIPHLGAGFTSITLTLSPIVTLGFASLMGTRRPGRLGVAGLLVGALGAGMVVLSRGQVGRPAEPAWIGLALLIPVMLAAGNVYRTLDWPPGGRPLPLAAGTNLASAAVLLCCLMASGQLSGLLSLAGVPALAGAQVLASAAMFAAFFRLQVAGGPVYLSQIGYVAAAVGLLSGMAVFGERYPLATWIGAAIIVAGVALTTLDQRRSG